MISAPGDKLRRSVSSLCGGGFASPRGVWARIACAALGVLLVFAGAPIAQASGDPMRAGTAAFNRQAYSRAASIFLPLAERGDARAQTYLGFMYANGRGAPQNYAIAARWYRSAAEQGVPTARYLLGLMYDKGQGVPQDDVTAYALVNLAAAHAEPGRREFWTRIRDAIAGKLTLAQLAQAQRLALDWQAGRDH